MIMSKIARQIATCCMLGYTPCCPGTITSVFTALVFFFIPDFSPFVMIGWFIVALPIFIWSAGNFSQQLAVKDPSCVVIDEFVGMFVVLIGLAKVWWMYLLAVVIFRILDITKPFPIRQAESLPGGVGIIMDDLVAGLIARGLLYMILAI